jgi:hypothetical protein
MATGPYGPLIRRDVSRRTLSNIFGQLDLFLWVRGPYGPLSGSVVKGLSTIQNDQEQLFLGWGDFSNALDRSDSMNRPKSANLAGIHNTFMNNLCNSSVLVDAGRQ